MSRKKNRFISREHLSIPQNPLVVDEPFPPTVLQISTIVTSPLFTLVLDLELQSFKLQVSKNINKFNILAKSYKQFHNPQSSIPKESQFLFT